MRSDLIDVHKVMRGTDKVNRYSRFPRIGEYNTRGHRFKVRGERFKENLMGNCQRKWWRWIQF